MKKMLIALAVTGAILAWAAPSQAWHGGWYAGWYGPYPYWFGYPAPYAYVPPVIVQPPQPTVYIQQQPQQQYWYFCQESKTYYPYVQQCPSGWMQVVPQAAPAAPR